MFEYKLLPVPMPAKKMKGRKTMPERMAHALTELMNSEAKENWLFSGQESFPAEEKSGLMGKEKLVECRYMVFRREVGLEEMPLDQKLEKLRERKAETIVQVAPPAPAPEPFPEPMPSPQVMAEPSMGASAGDGDEPTRIFSPFPEAPNDSTAPSLGPAEKT
ncbi:MAG: hypothetical protein GQ535_13685 [Rhodobacteraceae bacterium]|nr:hypothetical protein [Paracoccaceae bacterium]